MKSGVRTGLPLLRDPTLNLWHFFLLEKGRTPPPGPPSLGEAARGFLEEVAAWAGEEAALGLSPPSPSSWMSQRLAGRGWTRVEGELRAYEARLYLDTLYVVLQRAREGEAAPGDLSSLLASLPSPTPDPGYLGRALCLVAELESPVPEETLRALAREVLKGTGGFPGPQDPQAIPLPFGHLFPLPGEGDGPGPAFLLLLHNPSAEASSFVNLELPRLLHHHLKVLDYRKRYESFRKNLGKEERQVEDHIEEAQRALREDSRLFSRLHRLEDLDAQISQDQMRLISRIAQLEEARITLGVALDNLKALLEGPTWAEGRDRAREFFLARGEVLLRQMEVDLRYARATEEKARVVLGTLDLWAQLLRARLERYLTFFVSLLALTGLAQPFPEIGHWPLWLRSGILVLAVGLVLGLVLGRGFTSRWKRR